MEMFAAIFGKISERYVDLTDAEIAITENADMGERASFIIAQTVCIDVVLYQQNNMETLCVAHVYETENHVYNLTHGGELNKVKTRLLHVDDFGQFVRFIAELMIEFHDDHL